MSEAFRPIPGDSDEAVVAFSGLGVDRDRFHFFGIQGILPGASKLLVRDPTERWYNAGLPGAGDDVEDVAAAIERQLAKLGASRVTTVGSSAGGYAAILFGCMIGAERVVAFVPQTLLDPALRRRVPHMAMELQAPDVLPALARSPETEVDLVIGWEDLLDVFHALRLASVPTVRVLAIPGGGHAFARKLVNEGVFGAFIAELIGGGAPPPCEVKPAFDPATLEQVENAVFAWGRREWRQAIGAIEPLAERYPDWPAPKAFLQAAASQLERRRRGARLQP